MADLEKLVEIVFEGRDNVSQTMRSLDRRFDAFSRNVQDATGPLADLGRQAAMVEGVLVAALGAGLVYAYDKSKDLETAMIDLEKVVGDQPQLLQQARQAAFELSDTYGESTENIVQSIANFKQAGFDVTESIQLVKDSLDLMIAGDVEAAQSSEYLVRILKGFDAPASEAGRAIDILNGISNEYATNVDKLSEGMARLSPIADSVGISMEQTAGLLTPVIEVFQSGSEAARALRTGLLRLADPTGRVETALQELGVATEDANGEQRSAYEILLDVAGAYENLDSEQKLTYASMIAGKEQAARLTKVFDNLSGVTEVTAAALNSTGSAAEEVEKRLASSQNAVNRFVEAFVNLNTRIGDEFRQAATGTINSATDIENALSQIVDSDTFDPVWDALNSFFSDFENTLSDIAENLPEAFGEVEFDGLINSFRNLGESVEQSLSAVFGGDLDLSTAQGLEEALQRIIDLFAGLTNFTSGFISGLEPLLDAIGKAAEGFANMDEKGQHLAGQITGLAETTRVAFSALDHFKGVLVAIAGITGFNQLAQFAGILANIGTAANTAIGSMGTAGAATGVLGLATAFDTAYDKAVGYFGLDYRGILDSMSGLTDVTQSFIDVATGKRDWWTGELKTEMEEAKEATDDFYGAVDGVTNQMQNLSDDFYGVVEGVTTEWNTAAENVRANPIEPSLKPISTDDIKSLETLEPVEIPVRIQEAEIQKEIAKIESSAESLQTAMEWEAKVNIAQVEAAAETTKAAFEEAGKAIESTNDSINSLVGTWAGGVEGRFSELKQDKLWSLIEDQNERQEEQLEMQKKLQQAQLEAMRMRNEAMKEGEPMMKISVDEGIEPALRLVVMNIIELMQTEFNEYANQFLIGLESTS